MMIGETFSMEIPGAVTRRIPSDKVHNINGYHHAVKITRFFLRLLGNWPDPKNDYSLRSIHFALVITTMFCFETASQTVKMTKNLDDLNLLILIIVDCNAPATISIIKLSNVWYHRHVLKRLVQDMIEDWKKPREKHELDIMWKYAKLSRYCTVVIIMFNMSALGTQAISNLWKPVKFLASGSEKNGSWPLYFIGSFPYDYKKHPNYELTLLGQCFSITCASLTYDSTDSFFVLLVLHLIGQLTVLERKVKNLNRGEKTGKTGKTGKSTFLSEFAKIYEMHNRLWRNYVDINVSFSTMFLMQMVPSMLVLCTQAYLLLLFTSGDEIVWAQLIFLLYFLILFLLTLFTYCCVGEVLRQKSLAINDAAYSCNWTTLPPKEAKLLILLMRRSQTPFELTVGKFAILSLNLYCNILKTSAGYLSMLLAVKDRMYE